MQSVESMKTRNVAPCLMVTLFCLIGCTHTFEAKGKTQVYEEVFRQTLIMRIKIG